MVLGVLVGKTERSWRMKLISAKMQNQNHTQTSFSERTRDGIKVKGIGKKNLKELGKKDTRGQQSWKLSDGVDVRSPSIYG